METQTQTPQQEGTATRSSRFVTIYNRALGWIPPKARLAVLAGSVVLVALGAYTLVVGGSASLNLVCRHDLRQAELSVSIDGKLSYTEEISGSVTKRFGIFGNRVEGTFSKVLTVPSGEHVVTVHLQSAEDGFDQIKQCEFHLQPGKEGTLSITTQRGGMSLAYQGSGTAPASEPSSSYSDFVRSMFVTVTGSALSAAIGFVVQDFLRSKKSQ